MRLIALLLALPLVACGDRNHPLEARPADAPPSAVASAADASLGKACQADVDCVGDWRPNRPGCGTTDRCIEGHCGLPPTTTGQTNSETGRLVFEIDGAERPFHVELVDAPFETTRGMMCRRSMQPNWGMLFFMSSTRVQSFWMFNTLIPLDLVFLDEAWQVVGVVERAEPLSRRARTVGVPSRYVLELKGGEAARAGLRVGASARFYPPRGQ